MKIPRDTHVCITYFFRLKTGHAVKTEITVMPCSTDTWCHGGFGFLYTQCWGLTNRSKHICSHQEIKKVCSHIPSAEDFDIGNDETYLLAVLPYILNCFN